MQTKSFLGIITLVVALLLSFPIYAHIFFPKPENKTIITQSSKIQKVEFTIKGMTCSGCEHHIKTEAYLFKHSVLIIKLKIKWNFDIRKK